MRQSGAIFLGNAILIINNFSNGRVVLFNLLRIQIYN